MAADKPRPSGGDDDHKDPFSPVSADLEGLSPTSIEKNDRHWPATPPFRATWDGPGDPQNPLNWPLHRKWILLAIISVYTLIAPFSSAFPAPALGSISDELGIDNDVESSMIVGLFVLGFAFGPLILGPLSEIYGRVPIAQLSNIVYLVFNLAAGFANTKAQLLVFRLLAGIGGSGPLAIGGGIIADVFSPEQRSYALAWYSTGPTLGPAIAPVIGGFIVKYSTWRWIFWSSSILDAVVLLGGFVYLRESYAPVLLARKAKKLRAETGDERWTTDEIEGGTSAYEILKVGLFRPFHMHLTQPIVIALSLFMAYIYALNYLVITTFPTLWTRPDYYNESVDIGGLHFIALGIGFIAGAQITAPVTNYIYRKLKPRSNGVAKPEHRLPLLLPGTIIGPIALFWYGWSAETRTFWLVPDIGAALFAFSIMMGFVGIQGYIIDAYTKYAASGLAAITVLRSILGFVAPLFAEAMYDRLGYGWGNTLLGLLLLGIGLPVALLLWFYGERLRLKSRFAART